VSAPICDGEHETEDLELLGARKTLRRSTPENTAKSFSLDFDGAAQLPSIMTGYGDIQLPVGRTRARHLLNSEQSIDLPHEQLGDASSDFDMDKVSAMLMFSIAGILMDAVPGRDWIQVMRLNLVTQNADSAVYAP
jgi:hypothetical protein